MGEEYYRPLIGETEHLLQSKENPNRVRGLSRDENNNNPHIPEWEKVELPDEDAVSREDTERQLQELAFKERQNRSEEAIALLETINLGLETLNSILIFLTEHPEIIQKTADGFHSIKCKLSDGINSAKGKVMGLKAKIVANDRLRRKGGVQCESSGQILIEEKSVLTSTDCASNHKNMSIEEARARLIKMILSYIEFKKNFDCLSNANMIDLGFDQTLVELEAVIAQYPALMDEKTQSSILGALVYNLDGMESRKIKEALHI